MDTAAATPSRHEIGPEATSAPGAMLPPPKRGGLNRRQRAIVEALADTAIPPGKSIPRRAGPVAVEILDQLLAESPRLVRLGLVLGLLLIQWSALVFAGGRFSRLTPERRLSVLDRWHRGSALARLLLRGILSPIKIAFYAEQDVAAALGYRPRPFAPKAGALDQLPPGDIRFGRLRGAEEIACEVAVVGSGAGGAAVAKELAERGRKVVLLEEGQYWTRPFFSRRPFGMQRLLYRDWALTLAMGRPGIPIPLGRTVGGTTTINSGTCFRLPDRTLSHWHERFGLSELTAEALAPHYEKVERTIAVQPVPEHLLGNPARLVARGAKELGLHPKPLRRNARGCEGSGVCCFGCPEDAKRSTNLSYVPLALAAGAALYTETVARKIAIGGGRAVGLRCEMGPHRAPLSVRAEAVVVSAGTILTPLILKASGLGRSSRWLGKNLSIHPATKVCGFFEEEVRSFEGVPQALYIDDLAAEGVMFEGASLTPDYASVGLPFYGKKLVDSMERYLHLASFGVMVEDEGRGSVRRGIDGRPLMLYRLGTPELERLRKGIEVLCRIFFRAGAKLVHPPLGQLPELHRESEVEQIRSLAIVPEDIELTAFHPLGTCRMANRHCDGVIDPDLEAFEVERLFVADGSIFPSSLGVNPQLSIMAFATRAAERIDARLSGAKRRSKSA
ncbi:MAG: GMC family oxidoreductase [Myxococcales bacterium]|nr:GMC family oxidoreductase [Myxococcales bacterium]